MEAKDKTLLLTLPNILSFLRILLVPVFVAAILHKKAFEALAIFTLAGLTDVLDGFTARIWRQKTKIGAFLDPAADKLLLTASFVLLSFSSLSFPNFFPLLLTVVVIGRDLIIAMGSFVIYRLKNQKTFYPSLLGKASTVCQTGAVFLVLFFNYLGVSRPFIDWIFYLVLAITLLSGFQYFAKGFTLLFRPPKK